MSLYIKYCGIGFTNYYSGAFRLARQLPDLIILNHLKNLKLP